MRVRPYLVFWFILNLLAGISIVLAPTRTNLDGSLLGIIDYIFGSGFLVAALLCGLAALLWSPSMQRRISVTMIRHARIVAQGASLCMMLGWGASAIIVAIFSTGNWLGVAIIGGLVVMQAFAISDGDLTPSRERYIWQAARKGI